MRQISFKNPLLGLPLFCFVLMTACGASGSIDNILLSRGLSFNSPSPATLGYKVDNLQNLKGSYGDKKFSFFFQIEIDEQKILVVGLSQLGNRLFALESRDNKLTYEPGTFFNIPFDPGYILMDLQICYWPVEILNQSLSGDFKIIEQVSPKFSRSVYNQNKKIIEIRYSSIDKWQGPVEFRQLEREYSFTIYTINKNKV